MSFNEKMFYQAVCDKCGAEDDGGDYQYWIEKSQAVEDVTENSDWFERTRVIKRLPPSATHPIGSTVRETVELICTDCRACDVCGTKPAYVGNEENYLVCEEHEDHVFAEVKQ